MRLGSNILVVQETDWIENLPLQSHHIMESLSKRGHTVRVVDYEAKPTFREITGSMRQRIFPNYHRTDSNSSVSVIRPGSIKLPGMGRLSSALGQFKTIFKSVARWCDVIVLYAVPTNGLQTIFASKLLAKPVVFHSFDILHRMTNHSFLRPPTWALERFVYSRADKVVVISAALGRYMEGIGVPQEDIVLLPPAVNTERFNPSVSGEKARNELGITPKERVVLFSGWLYEFSGLDLILESLGEVLKQVPEVSVVICGDGPLKVKLLQLRRDLGLERYVKILARRPYDEMPSIVASADICINPYLPDIRSNFAFPSKIAEYMAAGKAVLATDLPGTRSLLPSGSGVSLVPFSKFPEALIQLLLDDDRRVQAGEAAQRHCMRNFSLPTVTDRFENLLVELVSEWQYE